MCKSCGSKKKEERIMCRNFVWVKIKKKEYCAEVGNNALGKDKIYVQWLEMLHS